jgi:hypothetical protein
MIKEFLEKYDHLKIAIQHLGINGGGFKVQVYNTTLDFLCERPIFEHFISDFDVQHSWLNFGALVIVPINNWLEECEKKRRQVE